MYNFLYFTFCEIIGTEIMMKAVFYLNNQKVDITNWVVVMKVAINVLVIQFLKTASSIIPVKAIIC